MKNQFKTFPAFFSDSKNCKGGSIFDTTHLNSVHHGHPPQLEDHLHLPQGVQLHGQHLLHHERPQALCRSWQVQPWTLHQRKWKVSIPSTKMFMGNINFDLSGLSRVKEWFRLALESAIAWASSWPGMKSSYSLWVQSKCILVVKDNVHSQVSLLQQTRMLPPLHHPCPSPNNYISNLTRIPDDFYLRVVNVWFFDEQCQSRIAFWTKKNWPGWQGGSKKVKIWPRMGLAFIYFWPRSLLEAPKWVKDPGNGLKSIRGSWRDHFGGMAIVSFHSLKLWCLIMVLA